MKKTFFVLAIALFFISWTTAYESKIEKDSLFMDPSKGRVEEGKKYAEAGCKVKKGEPAQIQCLFAPGTCKKEMACKVVTFETELDDDTADYYATQYANGMVEEDYIDSEDWLKSYKIAYALLLDNSANEEIKNLGKQGRRK